MFGNKFTALSGLKGLAAASITAAQMEAVNAQIAEQGVEHVTLVLDSELEEHVGSATRITELQNTITAHENTIASHVATIADLKNKLAKPAVEATAKPADAAADQIPNTSENPGYELTSVDLEMKAQKDQW